MKSFNFFSIELYFIRVPNSIFWITFGFNMTRFVRIVFMQTIGRIFPLLNINDDFAENPLSFLIQHKSTYFNGFTHSLIFHTQIISGKQFFFFCTMPIVVKDTLYYNFCNEIKTCCQMPNKGQHLFRVFIVAIYIWIVTNPQNMFLFSFIQ